MMPPVSLPLKRGTQSARAGATASTPDSTMRLAVTILRMANSVSPVILGRLHGHEKNEAPSDSDLTASVAALHLTRCGLRGTVRLRSLRGLQMRDLATALKR